MQDRKRSKRIPVSLQLEISQLFKQDNVFVTGIHAPIEVFNLSKTGIGFRTQSELPLGYYFNAKLTLGSADSSLYCVVKIIRSDKTENDLNIYGCEFVGLAPILSYIFEDYDKQLMEEE